MESLEQKKERAMKIYASLKGYYPNARTALYFNTPFELLVATVLSAQCTDARVNMVTPILFKKYPTIQALSTAKQNDVENIIRSTGFYKVKAKNIIEAAKAIMKNYNGKVPDSLEQLTSLPGVGRKTANCVLGGAFGIAEGIVVDTHVLRLSKRMGLTTNAQAEKVEQDLMQIIPKEYWYEWSNLLILHGRKICNARNPQCSLCSIDSLCPKILTKGKK